MTLRDEVEDYEYQLVADALRACAGDVTQAAQQLDTPLRTLWNKIAKYQIDTDQYRP